MLSFFVMKTLLCCLGALILLVQPINTTLAAGPPFTGGHWVDLTHDSSADTIYWPTASPFVLEEEFHGKTPQGYFYTANRYRASEHGGTHMDAPIHFAEGGKTVDQLPIDQLTGAAVVVDVSDRARTDPE